ncbi:MAG: hypothetical protein IPQ12_11710 [Polaromonas sp.]|nr:hypothetical protein [Polaromonas sp.]
MFDQSLRRIGRNLLIFSFLIALPISFVLPFLSLLFILVYADSALVGIACLLASYIPSVTRHVRIGLILIFWILLSLIIEIPRIIENNKFQGIQTGLKLFHADKDNTHQPETISIEGISNPIVTAKGYFWEIESNINAGGMRESIGTSLREHAQYLDIPDSLWRRGVTPQINGKNFPKLVIFNENYAHSSHLKLSYFDKTGQLVVTYEKILPLPVYINTNSGVVQGNPFNFILDIFHNNFIRHFFSLNKSVDLNQDFEYFLNAAIGSKKLNFIPYGPAKKLTILDEKIIQVSNNGSVQDLFKNLNTTAGIETILEITQHRLAVQNKPEQIIYKQVVCDINLSYFRVGDNYSGSRMKGLEQVKGSFPTFLDHVSNEGSIFTYYCDENAKRIFALSQFGDKNYKFLKLQIFNKEGILQGKFFYLIPRWIQRGAFIKPGTLVFSNENDVAFSLLENIRWVSENNEKEDQNRYTQTEFGSQ